MAEAILHHERRPFNVPDNWLTRQAVELELSQEGRRLTHHKILQYIELLKAIFPDQYVDQGKNRAAYVSPNFRDAIRALHTAIESIENVPDYLNRTEAERHIGCPNSRFFGLVQNNPPNIKAGDMRILRNRKSQNFPHYSLQYCDRLKAVFLTQQTEPRDIPTRQAPDKGTHGPAVKRPGDVLIAQERQAAVAEDLKPLDEPQRRAAQLRIRKLLEELGPIHRRMTSDTGFNETIHQLSMAARILANNKPMPPGLDRLFTRAQGYLDDDE